MSFFSRVGLGWRRARAPLGRPPSQRIYVVDATGLAEGRQRNGNGQPSPRDHFFALRNLAQFAARERIAMTAVFIGRALREASEGSLFKGIKVHYTDSAEAQKKKMIGLIREALRSKDIVLIASDAQLEREAMALNAACMRLSTLKKAMEDREDRDREYERPARFNRGRPPAERPPESERPPREPEPAEPSDQSEGGVLDLIDPV